MTHMGDSDTSRHRRVTSNEITVTRIVRFDHKIHITLKTTEVTKIPMVVGFLSVPPWTAGADKQGPGMAAAIGVAHGSVTGQAQNRTVGKSGVPVEGTPRRDKEIRVTDTGTSTLQRCKG